MSKKEFDPDIEMQKIKEELNELIDTTEGKDKEMYQEILGIANEFTEGVDDLDNNLL